MTKAEIFAKDFYDIKAFSYRKGCIVTVSLDSSQVWDMWKAYEKLGATKHQFESFWDFVNAIVSFNA